MREAEIITGEMKEDEVTLFSFDEVISMKIHFDCGTLLFLSSRDSEETKIILRTGEGGGTWEEFFMKHEPMTATEGEEVPMFENFIKFVIDSAVGRGLVLSLKSIETICRNTDKLYKAEKEKFTESEFSRLIKHITNRKGMIKECFYKIESWILSFNNKEREKRLDYYIKELNEKESVRLPGGHKTSAKIGLSPATGREAISLTRDEKKGRKLVKRKFREETELILEKLRESKQAIIYDREIMTAEHAVYILLISKLAKERGPGFISIEQRDFLKLLTGESVFNKLSETQIKDWLKKIRDELFSLSNKVVRLRGNPGDDLDFTAEMRLFNFGVVNIGQKQVHRKMFTFSGYEAIESPDSGRTYWSVSLRPFQAVHELELTAGQRAAVMSVIFAIMADMENGQCKSYDWLKMAGLKRFRDYEQKKGIVNGVATVISRMGYKLLDMENSFKIESPKA